MNEPLFFTHAEWRVQPGSEDEFIAAWLAVAEAFTSLPAQPLWGTLLRSEQDPTLFYSFGPWPNEAAIAAMRSDSNARVALQRAMALCVGATPGTYRQVAHVDVRKPAT